MYRFKQLSADYDYHRMEHQDYKGEEPGYGVYAGRRLVAYVWVGWGSTRDGDPLLFLDMLEVLERRKGHGRQIVEALFDQFGVDKFFGLLLFDEAMESLHFWKALGVEFNLPHVDEEVFQAQWDEGEEIGFTCYRKAMSKTA